jgi:uncharacterized membrane protein
MVPARQQKASQSTQGPERTALTAKFQAEYFSGPIPPPSLLARYNEVVQGGAERILAMAERQSKHRELLESQVVTGNLESQRRGSLYSLIIALTAILGGVFLIYTGKGASGLATIITALVGLVSVFIYSQRRQSKERVEKSTALTERRHR